ncbi:MAG TPA: hypothetical protein VJA47_06865 [archaeon]|nr:hypothetical protein [archaeon]
MDRFEKTLRKIERLEKSWRYELTDKEDRQHSFGRVPEDKKTIAFWSVPRSTGEFLSFMVELTKPKTILELGCSAGYLSNQWTQQPRVLRGLVEPIE